MSFIRDFRTNLSKVFSSFFFFFSLLKSIFFSLIKSIFVFNFLYVKILLSIIFIFLLCPISKNIFNTSGSKNFFKFLNI